MLKDYTCTRCCRKKYDCLTHFIQCEDVIEPIINPKKPSYPLSPSYCNVVFVKKKHYTYPIRYYALLSPPFVCFAFSTFA